MRVAGYNPGSPHYAKRGRVVWGYTGKPPAGWCRNAVRGLLKRRGGGLASFSVRLRPEVFGLYRVEAEQAGYVAIDPRSWRR